MKKFKEWELEILGVDAYAPETTSRLRFLYDHVRSNALRSDGDVYEFGVFRGASLLAMALIMKELGSTKKIIGFDSFSGFPSYAPEDDLKNFQDRKYFSESFYLEFLRFTEFKQTQQGLNVVNPETLARSGDFSDTTRERLEEKIRYLELDNIELIEGPFHVTVPAHFDNVERRISSCNIDCDLYEGYVTVLPRVYDSLSNGGYLHLDEYYSFKYPGAKIAVDDFCAIRGIQVKKQLTRSLEFERYFITK